MIRMQAGYGAVIMLGVVLLSGCASQAGLQDGTAGAPTPAITQTPTASAATAIPTIEATVATPANLTLWLPEDLFLLATDEEGASVDVFAEQIAAFSASEEGVPVEVRLKRLRDVGGILPTLRSAKDIAPGIFPDITLIRREDLPAAVQDQLIQRMEGIVPSAIIGDLYPSGLLLGQVNNVLYGLPYSLEIFHVVYDPRQFNMPDSTLQGYLDGQIPLLMPAARPNGLNTVFMLQYLAAGGEIATNGALVMNEAALLSTFEFYEAAVAQGLISAEVLNYTRTQDYRALLESGTRSTSAVVSAQLYLQLVAQNPNLQFMPIPTESGAPITSLEGWIWVVTSTDPNQREHIGNFLEWMMDANRQSEYMRVLNLLPSQRTAARLLYGEAYDEFAAMLIPSAVIPSSDAITGNTARAIQGGLASVLSGERSATEATQAVLAQLTTQTSN